MIRKKRSYEEQLAWELADKLLADSPGMRSVKMEFANRMALMLLAYRATLLGFITKGQLSNESSDPSDFVTIKISRLQAEIKKCDQMIKSITKKLTR